MCDYRWGFGLVNGFTDHLQVITTNNYNTIVISTLYSSPEHTVLCSQSITRRSLLMAPAVAIPLPLAQFQSSQTPVQNHQLTLSLAYNILARITQKTTALPLL
jgi:hypothetical protein